MKIGICGMGRMGAAIAMRLIDCGHAVSVWNRDEAKTGPLEALGAMPARTPEELATRCEVTISMLLNADAIGAVYHGPQGILSGALEQKIIVDMSTGLPEDTERLGAAVAAKGARFVECPVGGTVGPAREGRLLGLVGGSAADVAAVKPVLDQLCRRIEHVGPVGSGAKLKLAVNLPLMVYWQALGEALALAKPLNLPPQRLIDILSDTSGTPTAMKGRGPDIAVLLAGESTRIPAFDICGAHKDLTTMLRFAESLGVEVPLVAATRACFAEAEKAGLGGADPIAMPVFWASRG